MARTRPRGIKQPHPLGSVRSRAGVAQLTVLPGIVTSLGVKISALPAAVAANETDQFEVNQGGTSRRITVDQLFAGGTAADWADITGKPDFDALYVNTAGDTMTGDLFVGDAWVTGGIQLYHQGWISLTADSDDWAGIDFWLDYLPADQRSWSMEPAGADFAIKCSTDTSVTQKQWTFARDGSTTLPGPLAGTTATFASGADGAKQVMLSGLTKGIRIGFSGTGSAIEGVDVTGIGSYQPLTLNASAIDIIPPLTLTGALTGTTAAFTGTVTAPGAQIQLVSTQTGAVVTGTALIPVDDTIPQITEGNEYMTCSITPKSATSKLVINVIFTGSSTNVGSNNIIVALFQDSTANAVAVSAIGGQAVLLTCSFQHTMISGTTSATTFRVRAGQQSAGTLTMNGFSSARYFGGVMASSIVIREVAV